MAHLPLDPHWSPLTLIDPGLSGTTWRASATSEMADQGVHLPNRRPVAYAAAVVAQVGLHCPRIHNPSTCFSGRCADGT